MMYTVTEKMNTTVNEYLAVKAQINQLQKAAENLEKKIKSVMERKDIDTMIASDHAVIFKSVETARLDTAAMKKDFDPDLLDEYMVSSVTKRFSVR